MKNKILFLSFLLVLLTGCNKQPEVKNEKAQESFEAADNKISEYLGRVLI